MVILMFKCPLSTKINLLNILLSNGSCKWRKNTTISIITSKPMKNISSGFVLSYLHIITLNPNFIWEISILCSCKIIKTITSFILMTTLVIRPGNLSISTLKKKKFLKIKSKSSLMISIKNPCKIFTKKYTKNAPTVRLLVLLMEMTLSMEGKSLNSTMLFSTKKKQL